MGEAINLFISSRDETDRNNIVSILSVQNNFHIIGIEKEEADTIIRSENLKPDILILDFQPPGMSGYELAPIIHRKSPATFIIILSEKEEEDITHLIMRTGVSGIIIKNNDIRMLTSVIEIVNYGGYYFSSSILIKLLDTVIFTKRLPEKKEDYGDIFFSSAERCIINDIAQGFSDDQIAEHNNFCTGSVRNFVSVIKRKTNSKNRIQIVVNAIESGLLCFDPARLKQ